MQCALNTKSFYNIFGEALIALAYDLTIDCNEEKKKRNFDEFSLVAFSFRCKFISWSRSNGRTMTFLLFTAVFESLLSLVMDNGEQCSSNT